MSTGILRALMQLFAIIAGTGRNSGREFVSLFLRQQLNNDMLLQYLALYEDFSEKFHRDGKTEKRNAMASVKVLRICAQINDELQQKEKLLVVVRLLEFLQAFNEKGNQEEEFVETVAESFNIDRDVFEILKNLVSSQEESMPLGSSFLIGASAKRVEYQQSKFQQIDGLRGSLIFLRLDEENLLLVKYIGGEDLFLNAQGIIPGRTYVFGPGSSLRGNRISPIFYSDILHAFLDERNEHPVVFIAENVSYYFPGTDKQALHQFNMMEESGNLVGIMGGSGAGKSTFLNVLNGNYRPTYGEITMNGVDVHREKSKISGWLGFVSQDDLLIEDLTVFQNLYYNAKLCFRGLSEAELVYRVQHTLDAVGLTDCQDLKVGSTLQKTISGGQRKRLNIALELLREPAVLFVDEPTSGLSSRDSENIMDLLKELTLRGKLIFVVIHQPSSDIFKMFDRLFLLDQGGYPIYYGNPVESLVHFKRLANHVNSSESECPHCGNVNPEQIFNIIEAKVVDEYGVETDMRRVTPKEWNDFYNVMIGNHLASKTKRPELPSATTNLPSWLSQLRTFFARDWMSKLANRQFLIVSLLEAPVLAFVLSLFIKYYDQDAQGNVHYSFGTNHNFPQYLFISVVVAIFLGLTVSAEEIIKDAKILKRERYLNLNRSSYLIAKILILFILSGIQSLSFIAIGNAMLSVEGMLLPFWLVLFSTSCMANVLGLNISASFNTAKVIYIVIPILIIPQILFSGLLVKFDELHPMISSQRRVPWIGNTMVSRWAFESMATYQIRNNERNAPSFSDRMFDYHHDFKANEWAQTMTNHLMRVRSALESKRFVNMDNDLMLLKLELQAEQIEYPELVQLTCEDFTPDRVTLELLDQATDVVDRLRNVHINYGKQYREQLRANDSIQGISQDLVALTGRTVNKQLEQLMMESDKLVAIENHRIIRKGKAAYAMVQDSMWDAPYYSPFKRIGGVTLSTFVVNLIIIWSMTLLLALILYFDGLRNALNAPSVFVMQIRRMVKRAV
jgi:ABC-type multidrug transport system ATPase subunit